jgi:DNA primase
MKYDIEAIKSVKILDFLPGQVRRTGKTFSTICPFHDERTPSFHIYPESNSFHCFGCDKSGDLIDLVMQLHSVDFSGACELIASRGGVAEKEKDHKTTKPQPREQIRTKNTCPASVKDKEIYARFYEINQSLTSDGRAILTAKGLSSETIDRFGWRTISDKSITQITGEFTEDALEGCGLFSKDNDGRLKFKFYYHRLLIPYFRDGEIVYLRARTCEKAPKIKFINLVGKDTQLYNYDALYGITSGNKLYVAEGETDTMTLNQLGLSAVGLMGATQDIEPLADILLNTFANEIAVVLCFDNDQAGDNAYEKNANYLWRRGIRVQRKIIPPEYKDITDWNINHTKQTKND